MGSKAFWFIGRDSQPQTRVGYDIMFNRLVLKMQEVHLRLEMTHLVECIIIRNESENSIVIIVYYTCEPQQPELRNALRTGFVLEQSLSE